MTKNRLPLRPARLFLASTAIVCLTGIAGQAQEKQESIVLASTATEVQWADVYKARPERADDPYFHVRVFEHHKGWEPWRYEELAFHIAVTPKALEASRIDKKAKIYSYKDVEFRSEYGHWLNDPAARSKVPVCQTDILTCLDLHK